MTTPSTELAACEKTQLRECERTIANTRGAFVSCGKALAAIRDGRLYREAYKSFEAYCQERWGWSRQRAHQVIEAADVVTELSKKSESLSTTVDSSRAARELAKVPESKRVEVVEKAAESGKVTAASIKEAAKETEPAIDHEGHPIPADILPLWNRAEEEAKRLVKLAHEVALSVKRGVAEKDAIFRAFGASDIADFDKAHYLLANNLRPHTVCPVCQGMRNDTLCYRRGYITKFQFTTAVDPEVRKMWKHK